MHRTTWHGCYDDSWRGEIVDEAFCHPAKMARGLVRRIFDYLIETGRLHRGDSVVDPFSGVGTTAIEGASRGMQCFGVELEVKFYELSLRNLELHRRTWESFGDPLPVIRCGDSRRLCEVLGVQADCVVGSPPFSSPNCQPASVLQPGGRQGVRSSYRKAGADAEDNYGTTPGQLGALKPGSVDAVVGSPPWEQQESANAARKFKDPISVAEKRSREYADGTLKGHYASKEAILRSLVKANEQEYGSTSGQLGNETGETFWTAASDIVQQCHAILRPGGTAVWVCKDFVRNKQRVPFSADWLRLAEACGFRLVEWVQASLVKEQRHPDLFGEADHVKTTERKSFFRRLAEKKGSPRIDHEDVLILEKVAGTGVDGFAAAVVGSPPYAECLTKSGEGTGAHGEHERRGAINATSHVWYGTTDGQLGAMRPGRIEDVT